MISDVLKGDREAFDETELGFLAGLVEDDPAAIFLRLDCRGVPEDVTKLSCHFSLTP